MFWVHASNTPRFDQAYQEIAKKLNLPGWEDPEIDTRRLVCEGLDDGGHDRWLMILDNADDAEMFFPKAASDAPSGRSEAKVLLSQYIPQKSTGSIIITTRSGRLGRDLANGEMPTEVKPFTIIEAERLLRSKVLDDAWNEVDARKLLEALGYIPLAITQAAAFISHNSILVTEYLAALNKSYLNLKGHLSTELQDPRRDSKEPGAQNSVFRTWKLSFDQIRKQEPRAAEMLSLMAVLDRQGIPKMLLCRKDD